jgi:predicted Zn-dependent protease with MMP-like domain
MQQRELVPHRFTIRRHHRQLHVGQEHGGELQDGGIPLPPQILLFLENIRDYAEGDESLYRDEVRLTYLHELGHYLGWDEDEVARRGLE